MNEKGKKEILVKADGVICCGERACVPRYTNLRKKILVEAHQSKLSLHPGITKMYQDLKRHYWWHGMKGDSQICD